jgi:DNA modification methylase
MIYIFGDKSGGKKTYNPQKVKLDKPYIDKRQGDNIKNVYNQTQKRSNNGVYTDRHPDSMLKYEPEHQMIYVFGDKSGGKKTYNPQMNEGKPYKSKRGHCDAGYYRKGEGSTYKFNDIDNKGTRHPHSILQFNNPHKTIHKTQKPVDLLEFLVKSFSNEGDVVLDFTMGSMTTGIACYNTNRNFIGIEKDKEIYDRAIKRFEEVKSKINSVSQKT